MLVEKLRIILCLFHLYKYLFYRAREYWADFKSSFQFSNFFLLEEMSSKPIILPPYTICRRKAFGQTQAGKQEGPSDPGLANDRIPSAWISTVKIVLLASELSTNKFT